MTTQVWESLQSALAAREDSPEFDGRLARAGACLLAKGQGGYIASSLADVQRAVHATGFVGTVFGSALGDWDQPETKSVVQRVLQSVPRNRSINRYAIVTGQGHEVAVLLASVEVELESFASTVNPGEKIRIHGRVTGPYERCSVFLTRPGGEVQEHKMAAKTIDLTLQLTEPGTYQVEVLGDGTRGPTVLANVPVQAWQVPQVARPNVHEPLDPATPRRNLKIACSKH